MSNYITEKYNFEIKIAILKHVNIKKNCQNQITEKYDLEIKSAKLK